MSGLLDGIRIVDLTDGYGAFTARVLGDLGAEVVRIEVPGGGEGVHRAPLASDGTGLHHAYRNAGKTIVPLDPDGADAVSVVDGLLAGADAAVVATGWGAGHTELSATAIAGRHGHLVVAALSPFGLTGPSAGWAATELVAQAMAGVVYRSGVPELPPVAAPGSYCEDIGAVTAAMATVIALFQAREDGAGQLLDVSAVLALAQCTDTALPLWSLIGSDQVRQGAGLYPLFACTDGLARLVLPMTPGDWRSLIAWLGSPPEWTGPEWEKAMLGPDERAKIMEQLPARFADRTRDEVTADGDASGLRITPVLTPAEVLANEHVVARATFVGHHIAGSAGHHIAGSAGHETAGKVMAGFFGVDGQRASVSGPPRRRTTAPRWARRPPPLQGPDGSALPLAGVRVLELGTGVAAPEAGRVLGEWGADVIKVESRRRPDFQRAVMGGDMNPAFASPNRGKRAFGADIANPEGRALVERLLPHVDVVLENSATGAIDRLGLGWDVISAVNPRAVLVSSQLYGNRGPWAWRKGYGPSARAVGGLTWLWAHGPDAPRGVQTIHPDHLAGRLGALGAVAALLARERTGRGCRVDTAQFEAVAALLGDLLLAESLEPGAAQPLGNSSACHAPWGLFRCADDGGVESWLALCVTSDEAWTAVRSVAGGAIPDVEKWRSEAGRLADVAALEESVGAWLRDVDAAALEQRLQAVGVAAGQALHPRLQTVHPQFVARGFPVPVEQPGSGRLVLEGPAFVGTRAGSPRCGPAPLPGQHTVELCRELLALDDDEITRLVDAGVLDAPTADSF